jgi:hypothetical protein
MTAALPGNLLPLLPDWGKNKALDSSFRFPLNSRPRKVDAAKDGLVTGRTVHYLRLLRSQLQGHDCDGWIAMAGIAASKIPIALTLVVSLSLFPI